MTKYLLISGKMEVFQSQKAADMETISQLQDLELLDETIEKGLIRRLEMDWQLNA